MQTRFPSAPHSTDRAPLVLGGAGCGCGILLAALVLVVLAIATASGGELPAVKPDPARPDITIAVQEAFFQQMIVRLLPGEAAREVNAKVQPGGLVAIQGQVRLSLLGQQTSVPFSLGMRLTASNGRLRVEVTEVRVSDNSMLSAAAQAILGGLGDQASQAINDQVTAGLGRDAYIMDVTTDGPRLIIRARWTGQ
jgi:hypothetical protein